MFSGMKKAAAVLSSSASGHSELTMTIFEEKQVSAAMGNVVEAKQRASQNFTKWGQQEGNETLKEVVCKMGELDSLWIKLHLDYIEQYDAYRRYFKHVLKGEKMLDESRKLNESHDAKISRIQKQVESAKKKADLQKLESLELELVKAMSMEESAAADLKAQEENHERFKFTKVNQAITTLVDANQTLHERCHLVVAAQKQLMETFMGGGYTKAPEEMLIKEKQVVSNLIDDLSENLEMCQKQNEKNMASLRAVNQSADPMMFAANSVYMPLPDRDYENASFQPGTSPKTLTDRPLPPIPPLDSSDDDDDFDDYDHPYAELPTSVKKYKAPKPPAPPRPKSLGDLTQVGLSLSREDLKKKVSTERPLSFHMHVPSLRVEGTHENQRPKSFQESASERQVADSERVSQEPTYMILIDGKAVETSASEAIQRKNSSIQKKDGEVSSL